MAAAAAIALNPSASQVGAEVQHNAATEIQHRAVQLTSVVGDVVGAYEGVLTDAGANLQLLGNEAQVAFPELLQAVGTNLSNYGDLISTGLSGAGTSLQNALYGGWYGGDDGFVFGLFGGTVTHGDVTESGSTLQLFFNALQQGNAFNAFGYIEPWALEVLDHTLKPLLSPFLNTAKAGATPTATIGGEISQTLSKVAATFVSYPMLKALSKTVMAPALGVTFGLLTDLGTITGDVSSANLTGALTTVLEVPAHVLGNLLNGYVLVDPVLNPTGAPDTGLLNAGSLLDDLLHTWPTQLATALSSAATPAAASALTSKVAASKTAPAASTVTSDASSPGAKSAAKASHVHAAHSSATGSTSTKGSGTGHSHRG